MTPSPPDPRRNGTAAHPPADGVRTRHDLEHRLAGTQRLLEVCRSTQQLVATDVADRFDAALEPDEVFVDATRAHLRRGLVLPVRVRLPGGTVLDGDAELVDRAHRAGTACFTLTRYWAQSPHGPVPVSCAADVACLGVPPSAPPAPGSDTSSMQHPSTTHRTRPGWSSRLARATSVLWCAIFALPATMAFRPSVSSLRLLAVAAMCATSVLCAMEAARRTSEAQGRPDTRVVAAWWLAAAFAALLAGALA